MFSVPTTSSNQNHPEPIFIDERADVLALVLSGLHLSRDFCSHSDQLRTGPDVTALHAAVKAYDKYDIEDDSYALVQEALKEALHKGSFQVFAIASRHNNLDLGRMAIQWMTHSPRQADKFDFWQEMTDATLSWQVALARLLMPKFTLWKNGNNNDNDVTLLVEIDMREVAEKFNPK
jgi:hypothetical protein